MIIKESKLSVLKKLFHPVYGDDARRRLLVIEKEKKMRRESGGFCYQSETEAFKKLHPDYKG